MKFKPYHYDHVDEFIRYYALALNCPDIITIMDGGIKTKIEAKTFCDFIPALLDQRLTDEQSNKKDANKA